MPMIFPSTPDLSFSNNVEVGERVVNLVSIFSLAVSPNSLILLNRIFFVDNESLYIK